MKELTIPKRKSGGRNNTGRIVMRHIGGGHKRRLRIVDFYRWEPGVHHVVRIEYDPGRSGHIALLRQAGAQTVSDDEGAVLAETPVPPPSPGLQAKLNRGRPEVRGGWSYMLAPEGMRAGDQVISYRMGIPENEILGWEELGEAVAAHQRGESTDLQTHARALGLLRSKALKPGNVLPLYLIPPGTVIHNICLHPEGKMMLCRAAGSYATIVAHHGPEGQALGGMDVLSMGGVRGPDGLVSKSRGIVLVRLMSGEVRKVQPGCVATVGLVSK
jgi:ribosomal protein L2